MFEMTPLSELKTIRMGDVEVLSVNSAAAFLGVHTNTIRRWANSDRMPVLRLPTGARRFPVDGLQKLKGEMTGDNDFIHLAKAIKKLGEFSIGNITAQEAAPEVIFNGNMPTINISHQIYDKLTQRP